MTKEIIDGIFTPDYQNFVINSFSRSLNLGSAAENINSDLNRKINSLRIKYKETNDLKSKIDPDDLFELLKLYMCSYIFLQDIRSRINTNYINNPN